MKGFLRELNGYSGNIIARMATKFLILSALRTIKMRNIKWIDSNEKEMIITIPADLMKKSRIHAVPISKQLLDIIHFMKPITGSYTYLFTGRNDHSKPISDGTVLGVIKRLGFANKASGHGFRQQFSTTCNEQGFNRDWIEKQLSHESGNIRGVYNHAQYLEGRREMIQWYCDYIDELERD